MPVHLSHRERLVVLYHWLTPLRHDGLRHNAGIWVYHQDALDLKRWLRVEVANDLTEALAILDRSVFSSKYEKAPNLVRLALTGMMDRNELVPELKVHFVIAKGKSWLKRVEISYFSPSGKEKYTTLWRKQGESFIKTNVHEFMIHPLSILKRG